MYLTIELRMRQVRQSSFAPSSFAQKPICVKECGAGHQDPCRPSIDALRFKLGAGWTCCSCQVGRVATKISVSKFSETTVRSTRDACSLTQSCLRASRCPRRWACGCTPLNPSPGEFSPNQRAAAAGTAQTCCAGIDRVL